MASIISAGTTTGTAIAISGDTTGDLAFQTKAGVNTITVPNATGTMMVSGNMPAFSAYLGTNQTLSSGTYTKLQINTEEFDTNNNYDNATNYRFTPTVAGYYQFSCAVFAGSSANTALIASIYKNGSAAKTIRNYFASANSLDDWSVSISAIIYMNGTTDYVELYGYLVGAGLTISSGADSTWFSGAMVRSA